MGTQLPSIPAKRYFTIGEVAELCGVKPHVLRYWEQEFTQLRPMKRRGNRRYYQHHEVLMIRRIRDLLYDQGFTISGARNRLQDSAPAAHDEALEEMVMPESVSVLEDGANAQVFSVHGTGDLLDSNAVRQELFEIRALLSLN
ncbi:MerR family transcriptional regulator [Acidovorax carolinensis]|uniref:MerR family transcriptional regulator n=1 Tax=Acidovorax carolinensis TaxID=553814 RepID=A0A240UDU8_9BURK|nr:MerR family transcriptional regulator [Acidovorax carolinensis]ART54970.1 MerR family transcriptional regulator [Acidovorax carolinensis]ART59296.1 MerR family transcriptional regulator [Acidovorax carolinensis]